MEKNNDNAFETGIEGQEGQEIDPKMTEVKNRDVADQELQETDKKEEIIREV